MSRNNLYWIYVSWQGERNLEPYQTETDKKTGNFRAHEKITPDGERVIFYKEKHALAYGAKMKEFLGVIEFNPGNGEHQKMLTMSAEEIRKMNLPKINPDPRINKVVMKGGRSVLWDDYFARR